MKPFQFPQDPDQRDVTVLQALAAGQYSFGRYRVAIDLLDLARVIDSTNQETYVMLSRICYAINELEQAIIWIEKAVASSDDGLSKRDQIFERRIRLLADLNETQRLLN